MAPLTGGCGTYIYMTRPEAGLCDSCRHQRIIRNTRGSAFSLCERSKLEPAYPRYPRLPVVGCAGYEPTRGRGPKAAP